MIITSGLANRPKWMYLDGILAVTKPARNMLRRFVMLVVHKAFGVLKVVTLVVGVTFVHPRLRRSWWCDVCPP